MCVCVCVCVCFRSTGEFDKGFVIERCLRKKSELIHAIFSLYKPEAAHRTLRQMSGGNAGIVPQMPFSPAPIRHPNLPSLGADFAVRQNYPSEAVLPDNGIVAQIVEPPSLLRVLNAASPLSHDYLISSDTRGIAPWPSQLSPGSNASLGNASQLFPGSPFRPAVPSASCHQQEPMQTGQRQGVSPSDFTQRPPHRRQGDSGAGARPKELCRAEQSQRSEMRTLGQSAALPSGDRYRQQASNETDPFLRRYCDNAETRSKEIAGSEEISTTQRQDDDDDSRMISDNRRRDSHPQRQSRTNTRTNGMRNQFDPISGNINGNVDTTPSHCSVEGCAPFAVQGFAELQRGHDNGASDESNFFSVQNPSRGSSASSDDSLPSVFNPSELDSSPRYFSDSDRF